MLDGLLFRPGLNQVAPEFRENVLGPQRQVNAFLCDRQQGVAQVRLEENTGVESAASMSLPYSPPPSIGSLSKGTSEGSS